MTPKADWTFCDVCGTHLIKKHFVLMRRDDTSWAVYRTFEKEVPPRCIYESVHEEEGRAKRKVAR